MTEFRNRDFVDVGFAAGTIIRITQSKATGDLVYVVRFYGTTRTILRHKDDFMEVVEKPRSNRR